MHSKIQRGTWYAQFILGTIVAVMGFLKTPLTLETAGLALIGMVLMGLAIAQFFWKDEVEPKNALAFANRVLGIRDEIILALRGVPNVTKAENAARKLTHIAGEISPKLKAAHAIYREPAVTILPETRTHRRTHAPH